MHYLKITLKIIGKTLLGVLTFILTYALFVYLLSVIPVNRHPHNTADVPICILTNGDHTDIVVPVKNKQIDWSCILPYQNTISRNTNFNYLALGWGDKGFYLNTPTWSQLKFSVAFRAATGLSTAAIHATYYKNMPESNDCKYILISKEQYTNLINYITQSFKTDSQGNPLNIKTKAQYGRDDAFYEARRCYSIFYTCNTWANNALKACGQKACVWTPLDRGIFYHYR